MVIFLILLTPPVLLSCETERWLRMPGRDRNDQLGGREPRSVKCLHNAINMMRRKRKLASNAWVTWQVYTGPVEMCAYGEQNYLGQEYLIAPALHSSTFWPTTLHATC